MKIPKKISVLGVEYKIIRRKEITADDAYREQHVYIGLCHPADRSIELTNRNDICIDLIEQTLFHECTHAILQESGLDIVLTQEQEETFAQVFGNAFHQIFKQML